MYNVGLPSNSSLYKIQAERILKLQELSNCKKMIFWYIMASEFTEDETREYFEKNEYFGLKKEQILLFSQPKIPSFTNE
jgi:UDP-N-acetylglucosamine/UDP-N-acetylgalactosamine diphosphorylase